MILQSGIEVHVTFLSHCVIHCNPICKYFHQRLSSINQLKLIDLTQPLRPLLVHCLDKIFTLFSLQLLNLVVFNTSCWHRASYIYWTKRISESQHICRLWDLGQHQFYKYWLPRLHLFFWPLWMHHTYNLLINWHIHSK